MATKIFDMSVNMGHSAIRILQTCLGITADGLWGPGTCAAVNAAGDNWLNFYRSALAQHYQNLVLANPALAHFLNGWLRRAAQ
jgi:lysozyme family protein